MELRGLIRQRLLQIADTPHSIPHLIEQCRVLGSSAAPTVSATNADADKRRTQRIIRRIKRVEKVLTTYVTLVDNLLAHLTSVCGEEVLCVVVSTASDPPPVSGQLHSGLREGGYHIGQFRTLGQWYGSMQAHLVANFWNRDAVVSLLRRRLLRLSFASCGALRRSLEKLPADRAALAVSMLGAHVLHHDVGTALSKSAFATVKQWDECDQLCRDIAREYHMWQRAQSIRQLKLDDDSQSLMDSLLDHNYSLSQTYQLQRVVAIRSERDNGTTTTTTTLHQQLLDLIVKHTTHARTRNRLINRE